MYNRLDPFIENYNLLDNQHGFCSGRSALTAADEFIIDSLDSKQ